MKSIYPVIFTQTDTDVLIEVPDLKILTQSKDMVDAIDMARDAIGLKVISMEDDGEEVPKVSDIRDINKDKGTFSNDGENYLLLVDVDFVEYRRKVDNKVVRRNVTIPNWLNLEANKAHINVSKVLQEALMDRLDVYK